jgi:TM2 domain-containing membrane protein YozV
MEAPADHTHNICLSWLGVDHFYQGQAGWGIVKLITMGGFGVWYAVDLAIAAYEFGKTDRQTRGSSASTS